MNAAHPSWVAEIALRMRRHFVLKLAGTTAFTALFFVAYFHLLRHPNGEVTTMPLLPGVGDTLVSGPVEDADAVGVAAVSSGGSEPQATRERARAAATRRLGAEEGHDLDGNERRPGWRPGADCSAATRCQ